MANRGWEEDLRDIAQRDANILIEKDPEYGSSWKARGGIGAFMQGIARKWDRLEIQAKAHGYDIFAAIKADPRPEGIRDDIGDLRRYLLLIEAEIKSWGTEIPSEAREVAAAVTEPRVGPQRGRAGTTLMMSDPVVSEKIVYRGRPATDHPSPYGYDREEAE